MTTNVGQISNPALLVRPSQNLCSFITNIKVVSDIPMGISNFVFKNKVKEASELKPKEVEYLITDEDREFIETLNLDVKDNCNIKLRSSDKVLKAGEKVLNLQDLYWLYEYIRSENENNDTKVYLHELLEGSEIILPKNAEIPRNEELERRCRRLKAKQENKEYQHMTKNVDSTRRKLPEDTISYQLKQMNRHLIAIFQFIISVAAGFAFGFIGVELLLGSLDFGFRLLLGIICALTIALAELYFLAKRLNEDLYLEYAYEKKDKSVKVD